MQLQAAFRCAVTARAFQYPRTDRGVCNIVARYEVGHVRRYLSVSSNGSWCATNLDTTRQTLRVTFSILERIVVCATMLSSRSFTRLAAFSILERIVVCATLYWFLLGIVELHLSVSSNGSWCVQQKTPTNSIWWAGLFQYPRTDRGVCNNALKVQPIHCV